MVYNSTALDSFVNLLQLNLLATVKLLNQNHSVFDGYICLRFMDFILMPSSTDNSNVLSLNFKFAVISDETNGSSVMECTKYFLTRAFTKAADSKTTKPNNVNPPSSSITGLNMKQVIMICICILLLGGVSLAAAGLRIRYYCKRRRTQCKDESYGYAFGSRCSFSELGLDNGRRLNISRTLNYPTLEIYPNTFYQTVQSLDTPQIQHNVASFHTHHADLVLNRPLFSVASNKSPILPKTRQSVTDIHRMNRNAMTAMNKRPRRHSLTNKIDAVMTKHFQKTGITPRRHFNRIIANRSESIDIIKSANLKHSNLKHKPKDFLKGTRSCSERLNLLIK